MFNEKIKAHENPEVRKLWVDSKEILSSLGVEINTKEYTDISSLSPETLFDTLSKSVMWLEYLNQVVAATKYFKTTTETKVESTLSSALLRLATQQIKGNEAKSIAKGDIDYITQRNLLSLLESYEDYLKGLCETINRYHYMVKSKLDYMKATQNKY
jgi:hypothetical protein